jgi:hypothetical protein
MTPLSPYRAASEGFRLIWREPKAVLAWIVLWFATFSAASWVVAASRRSIVLGRRDNSSLDQIAHSLGPFGALLILLFLVVWLVTVVATFRAVLRPDERRWFYLRLGVDEARLGVLTLVAFLVVLGVGSAPAYLVFVLASPIMGVAPAATRLIAELGVLVTVWVEVWLGVRLSLIAVETYSEGRFHLGAYWPVTSGRFWYLLACYFLIFLASLGLSMLFAPAIALLTPTSMTRVGDATLLLRGGLLLQAGVLAALISAFWTVSWTIFCACQAHAFRAIVGEGRDGVAPA